MSNYLGEMGDAVAPHDAYFDYFDQRIRVHPDFCELDLLDFIEASAAVDENSPQAVIMVKDFLRLVVHPDDFEAFWKTAKANRQRGEMLMRTIWKVVEILSGREHTSRPSDSSGGPSTTGPTSTGALSSVERAMTALDGRADLQLAVRHAQRAQAAA